MRFYVLVSYSPHKFEETLRGLPRVKTQVVINTLGDEQALIDICDHYEVPYVITESDGTPATGKNSMMDVFLESDDDYGVFIDGGDIITPTGVEYYQKLAQHPNPPDLLVLYKQVAVMGPNIDYLRPDMLASDYPKEWKARYPMDKNLHGICHMTEDELYEYLKWQGKIVGEDELKRQAGERYKFHQFMNKYSEKFEYMTRMVFISRKAALHMDYDSSLMIGEDTVQYFKLKKLGQEKVLRVYKKPDGIDYPPTYLQVPDSGSVTAPNVLSWDWCTKLNAKLEQMEADGELPKPNLYVPTFRLT